MGELKRVPVTVGISTKNRYFTTLPMAISAICCQTVLPQHFILFDDGEHKDLRAEPVYMALFSLLNEKGIGWEVKFGRRVGQVANHQAAIELSNTEWIWRVDDDDVPEANCLEMLYQHTTDPTVGAIGGLVLMPGSMDRHSPSSRFSSKIEDIFDRPPVQWNQKFDKVVEVDHLNNSFLYRREAALKRGYPMNLSPVGHREETIFTYNLRLEGYKVLVEPRAVTWHLRDPNGGIRSYANPELYQQDEYKFHEYLRVNNVQIKHTKIIVLQNGLGDHLAFKQIWPEVKKKYANQKLILSVCYPETFEDEKDVEIISIAEAMHRGVNLDEQNVYGWCQKNNWNGHIVDAYRAMHLG